MRSTTNRGHETLPSGSRFIPNHYVTVRYVANLRIDVSWTGHYAGISVGIFGPSETYSRHIPPQKTPQRTWRTAESRDAEDG